MDKKVKRFGYHVFGPSWTLIIPYAYGSRDMDDLRELSQRLTTLRDNVRALLWPFIKNEE